MTPYPQEFIAGLCDAIRGRQESARPTLVAIDGPGCSGKSTLASGLRTFLGEQATDLGLDDFFVPFSEQCLMWTPEEDLSTIVPHLRWTEIEALVLDVLPAGRVASYRPYLWGQDVLGPEETVSASAIVLVEGLYALHPRLRAAYDFKIWIDTRRDDRMSRVAIRDGSRLIQLWNDLYVPREQAYIDRCRPHEAADIVVLGAGLSGASTRQSFAWNARAR